MGAQENVFVADQFASDFKNSKPGEYFPIRTAAQGYFYGTIPYPTDHMQKIQILSIGKDQVEIDDDVI